MAVLFSLAEMPESAACSCELFDATGFIAQDGALPANAKGVLWVGRTKPEPGDIAVYILRRNHEPRAIAYTVTDLSDVLSRPWPVYLVSPKAKLSPGQRLRFVATNTGRDKADGTHPIQTRNYVVSSKKLVAVATPLALTASPATVGQLVLRTSGMCSSTATTANQALALVLPPALLPFVEQLWFETLVDGNVWQPATDVCDDDVPGRSWVGPAKDLIYRRCSTTRFAKAEEGVVSDAVVVRMRVTAPSVAPDFQLESDTFDVKLTCPAPPLPNIPAAPVLPR